MPHKQAEHQDMTKNRGALKRFAWLSIGAAILTIVLKTGAYFLTGSVGLLSDALESFVNLAGAFIALAMLSIASRPEDEDHPFGHSKAEYFSSGVEGGFIIIAAGGIAYTAIERLINPQPLEQLGIGLVISAVAGLVNLGAALVIGYNGKKHNSITLRANAKHLMTDVWTTASVIGAVGAVALTGWDVLDPMIALVVAANIVWTGVQLMRHSVSGLMDVSLPQREQEQIEAILAHYREKGLAFHALRTRQAAARRFVSVHILVPGEWTVHDAHHIAEDLEGDIRKLLPETIVFTHLEPIDDAISLYDIHDQ